MFRFKSAVKRTYDEQGYIYFTSRLYDRLPQAGKETIWRLCGKCAGPYLFALFEFVTTDVGAEKICQKYYISRGTLQRCVRRYYERFPIRFR